MKPQMFGLLIFSIWICGMSSLMAKDNVVKNGAKESAKPDEIIPVNENDVRILRRAEEILKDASRWNQHDDRECPPSAMTFSLYCALYKASEEVNGEFDHRLGALEEVRRTVEEFSKGKSYEHRLMEYNNDTSTTFQDIKNILTVTEKRLEKRLGKRKN